MPFEDSESRKQQIKIGVAVVIFIAAGILAWSRLGGQSAADIAAIRAYIDIETGQVFEYTLKMGDTEPVKSPFTKRHTGYHAESCYWTQDENGQWTVKTEPSYVLIKKRIDPTTDEKTYCPDCGRQVFPHNPYPSEALIAKANGEETDD